MLKWGVSGKNHFLYDEGDRFIASVCHSIMEGYFVRFRGRSLGAVKSFDEGKRLIDAELQKEADELTRYLGGASV